MPKHYEVGNTAIRRFVEYYSGVVKEANALIYQSKDSMQKGLDIFDREIENYREGFRYICEKMPTEFWAKDIAASYACDGWHCILMRFSLDEQISWYKISVDVALKAGNGVLEQKSRMYLGVAYATAKKLSEAIEEYNKSLVICRNLKDARAEGNLLGNLGNVYTESGNPDKAIEVLSKGLKIARALNNRHDESNTVGSLAIAYMAKNDLENAIQMYLDQLDIAKDIGDLRGQAVSLTNLGIAYKRDSNYDEALAICTQAISISNDIGDDLVLASALNTHATIYADTDRVELAIPIYKEIISISKKIGDKSMEAEVSWNLGREMIKQRGVVEECDIELMELCIEYLKSIRHPTVNDKQIQLNKILEGNYKDL